MKINKAWGICFALAAALVSLTASGFAQTEYKGKFTLPSEVRWGTAVLAPGEYELFVLAGRTPNWIEVRGQNQHFILPSMTADEGMEVAKNSLTLVNVNGTNFVRAVNAGELGLVLTYKIPKPSPSELARMDKSRKQIPLTGGK